MKLRNIIAIIIMLTAVLKVSGQELKGKMLVGGNLSFSGHNRSDDIYDVEEFTFSVKPNFGGFVSKSVVMGFILDYQYHTRDYAYDFTSSWSDSETKSNSFGVYYFIRYYKLFGGKFGVILTGTVGGSGTIENSNRLSSSANTTSKNRIQTMSVSLTPGFIYFVSPKFALETSFGNVGWFVQQSDNLLSDLDSPSMETNYNLNFGLTSLQLGFNYYFGLSKKAELPSEE